MESWRDLGPSRGPSERPGGLGIDFWLIWGTISGGILELKFMKIVKNRFGRRQSAPKNGTRVWMASNIDFSSISDPFWTYFWKVFWIRFGDRWHMHVNNATPVKYINFSSYPPQDTNFAFPDNCGKSLRFFLGKLRKSFKKRVPNKKLCRRSFLEPYWVHFGSILDPYWTRHR